ncbi:hypothetical protein ACSSWA_10185 [Melioribacter sp. Ez-97]|uniref:hypothetical protein n=1 Tax=Melioribacter sp. Ez-97 TaxID=3423434 RepID=UPI003EDA75E9
MTKSKKLLFWIIAFLITASSAVYQRVTGPTYPYKNKIEFAGRTIEYKLLRSHSSAGDYQISIDTKGGGITGTLFWRRYKFDKDYNKVEMAGDSILTAFLPKQPPAGKLEYYIALHNKNESIYLPPDKTVVIRFKGDVPAGVLIPHVIIMFSAMLFGARAGMEGFVKNGNLKFYTLTTIILLFAGGFILGPLMQYYAFGEFWTGFPFGYDLTDNKTLVAMLGWIIAYLKLKKSPRPERWVIGAALLMFIVYLIPHSALGSELDYSKLNDSY